MDAYIIIILVVCGHLSACLSDFLTTNSFKLVYSMQVSVPVTLAYVFSTCPNTRSKQNNNKKVQTNAYLF